MWRSSLSCRPQGVDNAPASAQAIRLRLTNVGHGLLARRVEHGGHACDLTESYATRARPSAELIEKIDDAFSPEEARDAFTRLGSATGSYRTWSGASIQVREQVRRLFEARAENCGCNTTSVFRCDDCAGTTNYYGVVCVLNGGAVNICEYKDGGCGFFWQYPCEGKCCMTICGREDFCL